MQMRKIAAHDANCFCVRGAVARNENDMSSNIRSQNITSRGVRQ